MKRSDNFVLCKGCGKILLPEEIKKFPIGHNICIEYCKKCYQTRVYEEKLSQQKVLNSQHL